MKKLLVCLLVCLLSVSCAYGEILPQREYEFVGNPIHLHDSETLKYTIIAFEHEKAFCYLTQIWMADPGRQITKATAEWEVGLALPMDMAAQVEGVALAVNGSGYVSPVFPEIPDNYPGGSPDYYYTPLGSLTITNGEIFRHLQGVPFYGLTLQQDGLHMHVGEDIESILPNNPTQTWSFYEGCTMVQDHKSILDTEWRFAKVRAMRTIIAKVDNNNYLLLTVTQENGGLSLIQCVDFLQEYFDPIWIYDLDGGPSSALMYREPGGDMRLLFGGRSKDADIMAFTE